MRFVLFLPFLIGTFANKNDCTVYRQSSVFIKTTSDEFKDWKIMKE